MCWYCKWGWPKPVADIYDKYVALGAFSAMHWGPSHSVWEDENFARHHVQSTIEDIDNGQFCDGHSPEDIALVRSSMVELLALPDEVLNPGADYDAADDSALVEDFPPPDGMEMVRR